jgi:predicted transport protein
VIEEPDKIAELSQFNIEDLFKDKAMRALYDKVHSRIVKINKEIWRKVGEKNITYYSPERVFAYVKVQKKGLRFTVFTNGENIKAVDSIDYEKGGQKWGRLFIAKESDIQVAIKALEASFKKITQALKRGDNTGWFAESEG